MALPSRVSIVRAGLGVGDSSEWRVTGFREEDRGGDCASLPCSCRAGTNSELMDPRVIGNWVPPWNYKG